MQYCILNYDDVKDDNKRYIYIYIYIYIYKIYIHYHPYWLNYQLVLERNILDLSKYIDYSENQFQIENLSLGFKNK